MKTFENVCILSKLGETVVAGERAREFVIENNDCYNDLTMSFYSSGHFFVKWWHGTFQSAFEVHYVCERECELYQAMYFELFHLQLPMFNVSFWVPQ